MMHTGKIAILAIQEAHLDQNMMEELGTCFEKNLKILISAHPNNPQAMAGVGFIINKQLIKLDELDLYELIPGRVAILKVRWLRSSTATILNVYAPNDRGEHANFWEKVITARRANVTVRSPCLSVVLILEFSDRGISQIGSRPDVSIRKSS